MISATELKKIQQSERQERDKEIEACMPAIMQCIETKLVAYVKGLSEINSISVGVNELIDPKYNRGYIRSNFLVAISEAIREAGYKCSFDNNKSHFVITWD
jgi:hypothetical protein